MYLSVYIYCFSVTLLDTKLFLAEVGDDQELLSNEYGGKVTEPNKEIEKEENSSLVQTETGSDYTDIVYDEADYDDYDYDIEKHTQTEKNVEKKANNDVVIATLVDKITKALKGERKELVTAAGSDYTDIEYDEADYDDDDDTEYRHSEHVRNDKKVRNLKRKDTIVVEF